MIERENDAAPRRYSDREVRQLLERATRADRGMPVPGLRARGLTLAELEEVAAEAHIDVGRSRARRLNELCDRIAQDLTASHEDGVRTGLDPE